MSPNPPLHPYQLRAVEYLVDHPAAFLWLDMGLGKTVSTLTAILRLLTTFTVSRVLVIAPKRVAEQTWPQELAKWPHLTAGQLTFAIAAGTPTQRLTALSQDADITTIGRDNLAWLVEVYKSKWPFDLVIVDESSGFKSPRSQRFKSLRKVRPYIDRIVLLTGTPASRSLLDLWSQAWLLDSGERLGRSYHAYTQKYFTAEDYMGYSLKPRSGAQEAIMSRLEDVTISMRASDYLTLPDKTLVWHSCRLTAEEQKHYDTMSRDCILHNGAVTAQNAAILAGKLLQIASGAVYSDESGEVLSTHTQKLDALQELVEAAQGDPLLVAYQYRHEADRVKALYPTAVDVRESGAIEAWNNRVLPYPHILLCHPQSAGHGLNLQKGGRRVIWLGTTWSLELYLQLNARLHRQGQTEPVFIHHIIVEGTIEEDVRQVLEERKTLHECVLDRVKEVIP